MYYMYLDRIRTLGWESHFSPGRPVLPAYLFEAVKYILATLHGDSCTETLHSGVGNTLPVGGMPVPSSLRRLDGSCKAKNWLLLCFLPASYLSGDKYCDRAAVPITCGMK